MSYLPRSLITTQGAREAEHPNAISKYLKTNNTTNGHKMHYCPLRCSLRGKTLEGSSFFAISVAL